MTDATEKNRESCDAPDGVERLVAGAMPARGLAEGLPELIAASLPSREEMRPPLHPGLGVAFGLTAVGFAAGAYALDLPARCGLAGAQARALMGLIFAQAALGVGLVGALFFRATRGLRLGVLRSAARSFSRGAGGRALLATLAGLAVVTSVWVFLGWFPRHLLGDALRAARSSAAVVTFVLLGVAAAQLAAVSSRRSTARADAPSQLRHTLRLVEAGGLVLAGLACAANYVIFVA
jgi:hypothetical protein